MPSLENNSSAPTGGAEQEALSQNRTMQMSAADLAAARAEIASVPTPRVKAAPPAAPPEAFLPEMELPDDALIASPASDARRRSLSGGRRRFWLAALILGAAVPLGLTAIGALTSPAHVRGIPNGHLVYLEADAPSEHTTTLRGLFVAGTDGATRLLVHESEPQDTDDGVREWITQPAISPDGTQVAFEKQLITLQEDKQAIDNQLWVMPVQPGTRNPPHLVVDLTKQKLKQVVGLAWDSDSSLLFLEDGSSYSVPTETADPPLVTPLDLHGLTLNPAGSISATRFPALTDAGTFAYSVQTVHGPQILTQVRERTAAGPSAALFALSPLGDRIAFVPPGTGHVLRIYDVAQGTTSQDIPLHWGWSIFGKREITSLRWSPDGSQIAYTVSKRPVPDDEIFVVTPATGRTVQLPYRTGQSAWDWGK